MTTITCSESGEVFFWSFKEKSSLVSKVRQPKFKIKLENEATINNCVLHRERLDTVDNKFVSHFFGNLSFDVVFFSSFSKWYASNFN